MLALQVTTLVLAILALNALLLLIVINLERLLLKVVLQDIIVQLEQVIINKKYVHQVLIAHKVPQLQSPALLVNIVSLQV